MAKIFVFSNTFINTLYFSHKKCDNYNQYIHDLYTYIYTYTCTYIHTYIHTQTDRERMRDQQALKGLSGKPLLKGHSLVYMCMYPGFVFGFTREQYHTITCA